MTRVLVTTHAVPPGSLTHHLKRCYRRRKVVFNHHFLSGLELNGKYIVRYQLELIPFQNPLNFRQHIILYDIEVANLKTPPQNLFLQLGYQQVHSLSKQLETVPKYAANQRNDFKNQRCSKFPLRFGLCVLCPFSSFPTKTGLFPNKNIVPCLKSSGLEHGVFGIWEAS